MKIQLSIINDKITVHYMDKDTPYMKSNYTDYKNLSEEDLNLIKIKKAIFISEYAEEKDIYGEAV